jgi:hypothetical protein
MRLALLPFVLALVGCLYSEPFLPGVPQEVDTHVLGRWRCVAPEQADKDAAILNVSRLSDRSYRAEFTAPGEETTVFTAYGVDVGGKSFLNAQEVVEGKPKKWTVARYSLHTPSILQIEFARDEPFRNVPKDQRLRAFESELKGNRLFEDYCACIRIKESGISVCAVQQ